MGQRRGGEFFATLKKELVHQCDYVDQAEARASIFEYIEIFYNRIRLHSALGGMSPEQFKQQGSAAAEFSQTPPTKAGHPNTTFLRDRMAVSNNPNPRPLILRNFTP